MKKSNRLSQAKNRKQKRTGKRGKRSLYHPKLGASNWRVAQGGRFAARVASGKKKGAPRYPVYSAYKKLEGACLGLQRIVEDLNKLKISLRLAAAVGELVEGLCILRDEATKLKNPGNKIRFSEAIESIFNP